jgi:hypothetical protein
MNAKIMFAAFFLVLGTCLPAQDSLRCLVIERFNDGELSMYSKPLILTEGSRIYIHTHLSQKPVTGKLKVINDSVISVDTVTIAVREIAEVGWWTNVLDSGRVSPGRIIGGVLLGVGTAGFALLPVALLEDDLGTQLVGVMVATASVPVFLTGLVIFSASKSKKGSFHKRRINTIYKVRAGTVSKKAEEEKRKHW